MVKKYKPLNVYFFSKKIIDYSLASFLLLCSSLVLFITAISIKLNSKGPIFFKQIRIGKDRKPFIIYKFRSMYTGCSNEIHKSYIKKQLTDKERNDCTNNGVYKLAIDPRVTTVGKFIRKTSIDELPQLFNVLKGDMSIVGPRPAIPYELNYYDKKMFKRFSVPVGITGEWQVNGRSKVSFRDMINMDLSYIDKCSLWNDVKILCKTIPVVFKKNIAY